MRTLKAYKFEIILSLSTLGLLGIFFLGLSGTLSLRPAAQKANTTVESSSEENKSLLEQPSLSKRLSDGNQSILSNPSTLKMQGIEAYADGDYAAAVKALEAALKENQNDPEALIYLNNARIGEQSAHTLAVIAPIGATSEIGLEILRGAGQAQNDFNQVIRDGLPIKLLIADDDNDPDIARSVAAELVKRSEVLGVLGHYSSGVTLEAAPIYSEGKLPMVSAISTSVELSGFSPYIFRTVPSDSFAAAALARYMLNGLAAKKAVLYYDSNSAYSLSLKNEFTTSVFSDGGEVMNEYDLADANFDADQQILLAKEQGADVIMLASSTDTLEPSLEVMAAVSQELPLIGGDDLYHPQVLEEGGLTAAGLVVAVPWHILSDSESEFVVGARQLWGGDVSWRSAMAYDAIASLAAALKVDPSREGVRNTLHEADFFADGATGEVHFLPSGDRNRAAQLVQIQAGERSGLGFDFVPIE